MDSDTGVDVLASAAVAEIRSGLTVGLGTGRAATRAIHALARRVSTEGLRLVCVATSKESDELGRRLGLDVKPMEGVEAVDYLFDGADAVDPALRMIKGRGGAMTREKIVAHASARRVYLIQTAKLVARLGEGAPLPVEVLRFGLAATQKALRRLGLDGPLRARDDGRVYQTDNGNPVIDAPLPPSVDPAELALAIDALPGVLGHGLFLTEADVVLVEDDQGRLSRRLRAKDA
ncbi:MAG: ribose-5-phosphate isomerase RpiA [Myxococcaceae bacterium]